MINVGLLVFGITQFGTAITALISLAKPVFLGVPTLKEEYSIYRYLLAGLWISVSVIYFLGAFLPQYTQGAVVLALVNGFLEIIGYFLGFRYTGNKWFPYIGTLWIGIQLFLIILFN